MLIDMRSHPDIDQIVQDIEFELSEFLIEDGYDHDYVMDYYNVETKDVVSQQYTEIYVYIDISRQEFNRYLREPLEDIVTKYDESAYFEQDQQTGDFVTRIYW